MQEATDEERAREALTKEEEDTGTREAPNEDAGEQEAPDKDVGAREASDEDAGAPEAPDEKEDAGAQEAPDEEEDARAQEAHTEEEDAGAQEVHAEDKEEQGAREAPDKDEGAQEASNEEEGAREAPDEDKGAQEASNEEEGAQEAPNEEEGAPEAPNEEEEAQGAHATVETVDEEEEETAEVEEPTPHYNLRGNRINYDHQFSHTFAQLAEIVPQGPSRCTATDLHNHILATGLVFNQMSAKAGVKRYGARAVEAIVKECKQLNEKDAFKPRNMKDLTSTERKQALRSITLVKEKRCGKIKGCTVADGRSQCDYILQEDSTSPTVSIKGLMISITIDAKQKNVTLQLLTLKEHTCMPT